jgi:hypothetical protein
MYPDVLGSDGSNGVRIRCRYGEGLIRRWQLCPYLCPHPAPWPAARRCGSAPGCVPRDANSLVGFSNQRRWRRFRNWQRAGASPRAGRDPHFVRGGHGSEHDSVIARVGVHERFDGRQSRCSLFLGDPVLREWRVRRRGSLRQRVNPALETPRLAGHQLRVAERVGQQSDSVVGGEQLDGEVAGVAAPE